MTTTTETTTWWQRAHADSGAHIAYFSMEFALSEELPIYSGGLGVLAGDHLKAAAELGIPLVGVGLLYRTGYFRQSIDDTGRQAERHAAHRGSPAFMKQPPRIGGRRAAAECNSACSPVRMHRRLDRTRAERRRRARYRVNPSANNDLDDTSSLLQSRRHGSGRGAAAVAVRQAEAEVRSPAP